LTVGRGVEIIMAIDCERVGRLLERYYDRRLSGGKFDEISEHLRQCEDCSSELEKLECLGRALRAHFKDTVADEDLARVWKGVDAAVGATSVAGQESILDRIARVLWIPKPAWAAVTVVAVLIVLALAYLPGNQTPTLAANDCIIDSVDSEDCSVMVYEVGDSKMKIIWVMEQQQLAKAGEKT
jgi:anti-sigma factor RsiW